MTVEYVDISFAKKSYTASEETDLYQLPPGGTAKIEALTVVNTTAGAITVAIWIASQGDIRKAYLRETLSIAANSEEELTATLRLTGDRDKIRFEAGATGLEIYGSGILRLEGVSTPQVFGVEWDRNTDTWRHIDEDGEDITPATGDFDAHPVWGNIRCCNIDTSGNIAAFLGDEHFAWDGTVGRVMVRYPKCWVKTQSPAANVYRWWISSAPKPGFSVHPAFFQSGIESDEVFLSAYHADMVYDDANSHVELHSRTGVQPFTGGQIWEIDFDAGENEPAVGDEVETTTDSGFHIVDYVLASGTWAGGDATGSIWVRKPGADSCGMANDETITNVTQTNTLAVQDGAASALALKISDARTYAGNIGAGWAQMDIWDLALMRLLYYIEYADPDAQTTIGKGVVDKASGTGFAGELNGIDGIDAAILASGNGTAIGTGTDGLTPVAYRYMQNMWGNVHAWIDGFNAIDASYQVLTPDGLIDPKDDMDSGQTPLASTTPPIADSGNDGYQDNILWEPGFEALLLPGSTDGSDSSYLYDYFYAHRTGNTNVLRFGGHWNYARLAGPGSLLANYVSSTSYRLLGARLKFKR